MARPEYNPTSDIGEWQRKQQQQPTGQSEEQQAAQQQPAQPPAQPQGQPQSTGSGGGNDGDVGGGSPSSGSSGEYYTPFPGYTRTNYNEQAYLRNNPDQPLDQKAVDAAKKKERREKRMANAKSIMDTLSRVANFAATTQGAPSAKWGLTAPKLKSYLGELYDRYQKQHDSWLTGYNNALKLDEDANKNGYANAFKTWVETMNQKRADADQRNKDAESAANVNNINARTKGQELENEWKPEMCRSQVGANNASAYASWASGRNNDKKYYRVDENGDEVRYTADNQNEWESKTRSDAFQLHISDTYDETSTTSKTNRLGGSDGSSTTKKSRRRTPTELASATARVRKWNKKKQKEDPSWDINTPADATGGYLGSGGRLFDDDLDGNF